MLRLLKQFNTVQSPLAVIGGQNRWIRSKHTVVMSFGDGSHRALGLSTSAVGMGGDAYEPTPVSGLPFDVCSISAGHYHSLPVTCQGEVWAWGRNVEGRLGRGLLVPRESWNEPKKVQGLGQVRVRAAFAFAFGVVSTTMEMMALCGSGGSPSVDSLVLEKESSSLFHLPKSKNLREKRWLRYHLVGDTLSHRLRMESCLARVIQQMVD